MRIHIATLFPEMFQGPFQASILRRAVDRGLLELRLYNIRDYATDPHRTVDDAPYGGGPGMVMKPEPLFACLEAIRAGVAAERDHATAEAMPVILLTPQGQRFTQALALELARQQEMVLLCGHYEGVDERVHQHLATLELSIGDYVLTGGEPAAVVVVDAVARLIPGVVGHQASVAGDSYMEGLLQHPQYTRPAEFRGWGVPDVLLSGDHARVAGWRREQALLRTVQRRPDLLERAPLSPEDQRFLEVAPRSSESPGDL